MIECRGGNNMVDDKRPNAALINREWFEAAKTICQPELLGKILYAATEYVLYGKISIDISGQAGIILAMIKPSLDSDIAKYMERCARNAANARSKRVGASGSEWVPTATSGEQQQQQPQPQPQQQPQSLYKESEDEGKREKFSIFGYFWSVGSVDPKAECQAFWAYYESLGWKNNKGAPIVSKLACARMWRRQFETRPPKQGAAEWFGAFKECKIPDISVFITYMGAEYIAEEKGAVRVNIRANEPFIESIKEKVPECVEVFRRYIKADRVELVAV